LKRKLTIVVMVVLAAIFIATPVLAAGSSHPTDVKIFAKKKWEKPTVISMTGTLDGDPAAGTITIEIRMTNKAFIQYRGKTIDVYTDGSTKYFTWDGKTRLPYSFRELEDGDKVSINARLIGDDFYARRVQVSQPRIP
jgi:hypothetical protein